MEQVSSASPLSRRELLRLIGTAAGGSAMYQAMSAMGYAADSPYRGPIDLSGAPKGVSVLVLGAGVAGMTAAYELRNAGYDVKVLEYNGRAGGRNWSLRGGDSYTELGGYTQQCGFDKDLYINPGPWRIPFNHRSTLYYTRKFGVPLEVMVNENDAAYAYYQNGNGPLKGKRVRHFEVKADMRGHTSELVAKAVSTGKFDGDLTPEDKAFIESIEVKEKEES